MSKTLIPSTLGNLTPGTVTPGPLASMTAADLAEILFCCGLQESDHPSSEQVRSAIRDRFGACGGDGSTCVALVAQEAGDHPEIYSARMRWALTLVSKAFPGLGTVA